MTIKEIAKLAGVSISTVSKIVNNKADNINIETRNRVLKIVKEYNYTPYGTAKNISNAKTFVIGVLLRHSTLLNLMLKGIMDMAQKHGYNVLLCDSMDSEEKELKHITALCRHHVDGVIWEPVSENSIQYEHYFQEQDIAVSYINSSLPEASHCLDFMQMWYRDILMYKTTKDLNLLIFKDEFSAVKKAASLSSYEGLERILEAIDKARVRLDANVNMELVMELLLLTMKEN